MKFNKILASTVIGTLVIAGCGIHKQNETQSKLIPAAKFDLSTWKITVPTDKDNNGKVDQVGKVDIQRYNHPDYFYLDDENNMVFATPNKAFTTANSSNTRSELHQLLGAPKVKSYAPANNFSLKSHPSAQNYAQVGGNLQATVKVNHVAKRATYPEKNPAYSVVVGQIHATKDKTIVAEGNGFGYGNEPIKIYFKKWPNHQYGSVFWNYERNLPKADPNRVDIAYPVWGELWSESNEPGENGIALNEAFSYEINVVEDIMHLTFTTARHKPVTFQINLANNIDANGKVDKFDHPYGYKGDALFFKAGAYNQCSIKDDPGFWYPKCLGTGDWKTDKKNGDYAQVTFTRLVTGMSKKPQ
jgi:poly(beta-D-mannuronate) lyase